MWDEKETISSSPSHANDSFGVKQSSYTDIHNTTYFILYLNCTKRIHACSCQSLTNSSPLPLWSLCSHETLYGGTRAHDTRTAHNSHICTARFPHDFHIVIRSEVYTDSFIATDGHFASAAVLLSFTNTHRFLHGDSGQLCFLCELLNWYK